MMIQVNTKKLWFIQKWKTSCEIICSNNSNCVAVLTINQWGRNGVTIKLKQHRDVLAVDLGRNARKYEVLQVFWIRTYNSVFDVVLQWFVTQLDLGHGKYAPASFDLSPSSCTFHFNLVFSYEKLLLRASAWETGADLKMRVGRFRLKLVHNLVMWTYVICQSFSFNELFLAEFWISAPQGSPEADFQCNFGHFSISLLATYN